MLREFSEYRPLALGIAGDQTSQVQGLGFSFFVFRV